MKNIKQKIHKQCRQFSFSISQQFITRFEQKFDSVYQILKRLYGHRRDFLEFEEQLFILILEMGEKRPKELLELDEKRLANPNFFQDNRMIGGACYVDLFARNFQGLRKKIPYFKELGLTYLYLLPVFPCPEGSNDGGFAISSYQEIEPMFGTIQEFYALNCALRKEGISLAIDLVLNHTSHEHVWAKKALEGDPKFEEMYFFFKSEDEVKEYLPHLRPIFPEIGKSIKHFPDLGKWIWTTFYPFQWDLNYQNPLVFLKMLENILFLANQGVEIIRLDAIPFIWKKKGTSCLNLPECHWVVQAYQALIQIACPALLIKSEAIVTPNEVSKYLHPEESQLAYNPLLTALLWSSLATESTEILTHSMQKRFEISSDCAWVNYLRSHDDIDWFFSDEDASEVGVNSEEHRNFLNLFYSGKLPNSFAKGLLFQDNLETGECRIVGTLGSLAGLEKALEEKNSQELKSSIQRILLLHSIIFSIGGIPLIYLGDEVAMLNDYSYKKDSCKAQDDRWVHRIFRNWDKEKKILENKNSPQNSVLKGIKTLIKLRKSYPAFGGIKTIFFKCENNHIFSYLRINNGCEILIICNFSRKSQFVSDKNIFPVHWHNERGMDLILNQPIFLGQNLTLKPYQYRWIIKS